MLEKQRQGQWEDVKRKGLHMSTHVLDKELPMTLNHGFFSNGFLY